VVDQEGVSRRARALAGALEPVAGQVYFSRECHEAYAALGFSPSPTAAPAPAVAMPDGTAYFSSRGSILGDVPGEVVAAAFGVFNPAIVVPLVARGREIATADSLATARTGGATAQLVRILGEEPEGVARATELLARANAPLRPEGKPLFAGLVAAGLPGDPVGDAWRLADRLREYRGDAHIAAWTAAELDGAEIGLLTELYWGLSMRTYIRTRAWSAEELDAAEARLEARGLVASGEFTSAGRALREHVEVVTDRQCRPMVDALGDDLDQLVAILRSWGAAILAAGGYPGAGPHDLAIRAGGG
jgi:hypothetical protein